MRSAKELFNQTLLLNRNNIAFGDTEQLITKELLQTTFHPTTQ